jgi:hypothetical protein
VLGGSITPKKPEAFVSPLETITPLNAGLMPTDVNSIFANLKKEEEGMTVSQEALPAATESIPEHFEETYSYAPVQ